MMPEQMEHSNHLREKPVMLKLDDDQLAVESML